MPEKDEAKRDDINRIRQTLEAFCPFYSSSSPGLIPRGNIGAILPLQAFLWLDTESWVM